MNPIPFGPRNPSEDPLLAKAAELPFSSLESTLSCVENRMSLLHGTWIV